MINDRINLTVENHIAHVQFSRPDKMNALDPKMFEAIPMVGEQLRSDSGIRVVVVSGDGGNFCAGLDMSNFTALLNKAEQSGGAGDKNGDDIEPPISNLGERTHGIANDYQYAVWMWRELPMPVIAAIDGVALGGGLQIALGADMRFAHAESRFSILELKWGLVPDMSSTQIMRHLVPDDVIRELSYTARIFGTEDAREWGFITKIVDDPLAHAMQVAQEIASKNPHAVRAAKRIIDSANYQTAEEGLLMESQEQDKLMGAPNQIEAVMAELQKRAPIFND